MNEEEEKTGSYSQAHTIAPNAILHTRKHTHTHRHIIRSECLYRNVHIKHISM